MIVRPAGAWDAQDILRMWNAQIRDSEGTFEAAQKSESDLVRLMAARADEGHGFFVAEDNKQVTGFATYGQFRPGGGYAHTMEHTIVLDKGARGHGAGRALMNVLEDHARAAGVHSMLAGVSADNQEGIAFHKALGYARVAELKEVGRKFDRWMDLVLMQKSL